MKEESSRQGKLAHSEMRAERQRSGAGRVVEGLMRRVAALGVFGRIGHLRRAGVRRARVGEGPRELGGDARGDARVDRPLEGLPVAAVEVGRLRHDVGGLRAVATKAVRQDVAGVVGVDVVVAAQLASIRLR